MVSLQLWSSRSNKVPTYSECLSPTLLQPPALLAKLFSIDRDKRQVPEKADTGDKMRIRLFHTSAHLYLLFQQFTYELTHLIAVQSTD